MLHHVPMYFYSWFRRSVQTEIGCDDDDWGDNPGEMGPAVDADAAVVESPPILKPKPKSRKNAQKKNSPETDDISSTQDDSDISSTFWRRIIDEKASKRRTDAVELDLTCSTFDETDMRLVPFVSLDIRMEYSENSEDDDILHQHLLYHAVENCNNDNDSCSGITELLAKPKEQELFYGDLLHRVSQVKCAAVTDIDEVISLPEEEELDFETLALDIDIGPEKEATGICTGVDITAETTSRTTEVDECEEQGDEPPFVSGPTPVAPPRAPIPKLISFDSSISNDSTDDDAEDEETHFFDPVDPLIYGQIEHPYLKEASHKLYQLLKRHLLHQDDDHQVLPAARDLIQAHPETCQVRYHPPAFGGAVYPLSYFCATGHLQNIQTAYQAYPEAIGQEDPWVGTPLHYACYHNAGYNVVEYLVQKFPEAVRVTNYSHQTPVHMACMSDKISLDVVELLLEHYPTAAQLADQDGYTPFHLACLHGAPKELLHLLIRTSPSVIRMSTRSLQKALHVTCLHAPLLETVQLLLKRDPSSVRATDELFQTPLHCAVQGNADQQIVQLLVQAHGGARYLKNDFDETPFNMAERLGTVSADVLALLKPDFEETTPCHTAE
jgi:ankyrin repeat protein